MDRFSASSLLAICLAMCYICVSGVSGNAVQDMNFTFTCRRPSTPCDSWGGMCQPNGECACFTGASGLQCQIPASAERDGGNCRMVNPCVAGVCYDDGVTAKCDCGEGLYGVYCQNPMVHAECDTKKMVVNIFPYGYELPWYPLAPLTGENFTCQVPNVSTFLETHESYRSNKWQGFAAGFLHNEDPCAGNATVVSESSDVIVYSRTVYVSYSSAGPDPTDQTLEVMCNVTKFKPTPPPVVHPPARVIVSFRTPRGYLVKGGMKVGSTIHVYFWLTVPNRENFDQIQVESCALKDPIARMNVVLVHEKCAVSPVGETLRKRSPGLSILVMKVHKVPGMSERLSFQCRIKACDSAVDDYCSKPSHCHMRGRRSVSYDVSGSDEGARGDDVFMVESSITI